MHRLAVVKVGGSLFDLPDLATRLNDWMAGRPDVAHLLIAGGGRIANLIRGYTQLWKLDDVTAHWACVRGMQIHADLLSHLLAAERIERVNSLSRLEATCWVLEPWQFLRGEDREPPFEPLSATWDVTSDSIAARAGRRAQADELVLLKSAAPPAGGPEEWARLGYVDRYFPHAASGLPRVTCHDLRGQPN